MLCLLLISSTLLVEECFAQFIKVDVIMLSQLEILLIANNYHPENPKTDNASNVPQRTQETDDYNWFEIRSRENISIAVEVLFTDQAKPFSDACYINTGYFDKSKAKCFGQKPQGFPINSMHNGHHHMNKRKFQCWIGIPGKSPVELNIAYN